MDKKKMNRTLAIIAIVLAAAFMIAIIAISMMKNAEFAEQAEETDATASADAVLDTTEEDAEETEEGGRVDIHYAELEPLPGLHHVEIEIENYGTIKLELDGDAAPLTVSNFIELAEIGFYDGVVFHRIIPGFMIQGGDPYGTGFGGSARTVPGEFSENGVENPILHTRGVISMARASDPDSGSCQFFIMHEDAPHLDGLYAAFGYVTEGMEIVDQICEDSANWAVNGNGVLQNEEDKPVIKTITVID